MVARRFLKLLLPGFQTALKLPPPFSRKLNNTDLNSKRSLLKSCKGSWTVDIKKCDHGLLHFLGKGWEECVSEHNLKEGDFIVFEHNGRMHFNTNMFDEIGCEKDFATLEEEEEEEEEECFDVKDEDDVPIEGNYGSSNQHYANSFQITITLWNTRYSRANVPKLFAISNEMMQNDTVKLRNGAGDSWLAKLRVINAMEANSPPRKRFMFTGLIKFLRENKLEIGDKCIFELAQPSRSSRDQHVVMDVVFKRRRQFSNCEKDFATSDEVECFEHVEQMSKSQFQLTLTRWNFKNHSLNVPMSFARSNDMMRDTIVKLQDGTGDSWHVRLIVYNIERANRACEHRVYMLTVTDFMRDNDLKVGDTCIFKLVQLPSTRREHVVMDLVFERRSSSATAKRFSPLRRKKKKNALTIFTHSEKDEDDVPIEDNYGSSTQHYANTSRFQITIAKWNTKYSRVNVPKVFAISNDMMQNNTVKLRNGAGKSWLAKLQVINAMEADSPPRKRFMFTGLIRFLRENKLEIGDKCIFELAQPSRSRKQHVVMDVVFERQRQFSNCEKDFATSDEVECSEHVEQMSKAQFQLTLARWNFKNRSLNVPKSFARSNDMMRDTTVKLQDGTGDSWQVRLIVYNIERANRACERVYIYSVTEFMRDNDLKVGDTCIFKLVQLPSTRQEHVVMDVAFVR